MYKFTKTNPDFWVQLKGDNAGKPLRVVMPNSIGILTDHEILDPQFFYYVVEYLFLSGRFRVHIMGSVIPYIRQQDIRQVINQFLIEKYAQTEQFKIAV